MHGDIDLVQTLELQIGGLLFLAILEQVPLEVAHVLDQEVSVAPEVLVHLLGLVAHVDRNQVFAWVRASIRRGPLGVAVTASSGTGQGVLLVHRIATRIPLRLLVSRAFRLMIH